MIIVLAGTSEGREAAAILQDTGCPVLATVTSQLGADLLKIQGIQSIEQGNLDEEGLYQLLVKHQARYLVDATHPFAQLISQYAMAAARKAKATYLRLERAAGLIPEGVDQICRLEDLDPYIKPGMTVFSTLGSKHLPLLVPLVRGKRARLVARVLPLESVIEGCRRLGLDEDEIIALRGPFSEDENQALFSSCRADLVVSKESGPAGGMEAKIAAALDLKIPIVIWTRPNMEYPAMFNTAQEIAGYIESDLRR